MRIIGTGLLGTSIGLGLRRAGVQVSLEDTSPDVLALARDLGAGRLGDDDPPAGHPGLVVVATPPDVTARVVVTALRRFPETLVTDVASVKSSIATLVAQAAGQDAQRYIGSHPMAGRERSGPVAARGDLFAGRPWVLTPTPGTHPEGARAVRDLALLLGALPTVMTPEDHDEAVARVSHVPQVAASLVAARLLPLSEDGIGLAGQGLSDVTRIAGSDPQLWVQILGGNAGQVAAALEEMSTDLTGIIDALRRLAGDAGAVGARSAVAGPLDAGRRGHSRIPGKPGGPTVRFEVVTVMVSDEPGELGRLFTAMGEAGINLEEFRLEHVPGRRVGLAEVSVLPAAREPLLVALAAGGWTTVA
ncbi:MAG: prephenate dehydrogenase [Micrococcales bacterium]|nr:MAG: prephenate dehydrogenase [Micrococcales bacterium]PIE28074.1 MAG: prephenate dehydrogenase [Micrococcales bacterium]